jgi:D-alanyl-D-alanine dipeptidase
MPDQAAGVRHRQWAFGRSAYVTGRSHASSVAYLAWAAAFTAALSLATAGQSSAIARRAAAKLPVPLVYLRDVDATIAQDIKYATTDNFTGATVDGYEAGECILTRLAAEALRGVQADLRRENLSLKVFDCYRPKRAVRAFLRWVERPRDDGPLTQRFHPRIARDRLVALGYIAALSGHSRADTVDLTLVSIASTPRVDTFSYTGCIAPPDRREPDASIDMGTGFDCFDSKSQTVSGAVTPEQRNWRSILLRAMEGRNFRNYRREWWHFSYRATTGAAYDFPIAKRAGQPLDR